MDQPQDQHHTQQPPSGWAGAPVYSGPPPAPPMPYAPTNPTGRGQLGEVRETGLAIVLYVVTVGIYGLIWRYRSHAELKRYSGEGLGGGRALLLAFVPFALYFLTPREIGQAYVRSGWKAPVSAVTGLWLLLPVAGGLVWFVQTNGALNAYWKSLGAR
jgi:hypothetical protein